MADEAELEATIARLETALGALAEKVSALPDPAEQAAMLEAAAMRLEEAQAEAETAKAAAAAAEARVAELEAIAATPPPEPEIPAIGDAESQRLRAALEDLAASTDALREGTDGSADASLKAEVEALRAARALDLAEMRAILDELQPIMETENA